MGLGLVLVDTIYYCAVWLDIEVGPGSSQNLPSGYPMIVASLRSCLAGLPSADP